MARSNWTISYWFGPRKKEDEEPRAGGIFNAFQNLITRKKKVQVNDDDDMMIISSCFMRIIGDQNESC